MTDQQLKDELTRRGYYTHNLWTVEDVQQDFEATKDEAQEVLNEALTGDWIMEKIFDCINICADYQGLKPKEKKA